MGWWRFWDREQPAEVASTAKDAARPAERLRRPTHDDAPTPRDPSLERRVAQLRQRRAALLYDIAQGELALQPNNPWQDRIDLLSEAIETVETDLRTLDSGPADIPSPPLAPIPITSVTASGDDLASVAFTIGDEAFRFEEQVDWDQRGGPTVRGDLQPVAGDVERLPIPDLPLDVARALRDHLSDSIVVFATDLRDRSLASRPLPESSTLADLARPCPDCGGWTDWSGRCPACTRREIERQRLRLERDRLDEDRRKEADERHRLAEGLATTRRRLSAADTDLRSLGVEPG